MKSYNYRVMVLQCPTCGGEYYSDISNKYLDFYCPNCNTYNDEVRLVEHLRRLFSFDRISGEMKCHEERLIETYRGAKEGYEVIFRLNSSDLSFAIYDPERA